VPLAPALAPMTLPTPTFASMAPPAPVPALAPTKPLVTALFRDGARANDRVAAAVVAARGGERSRPRGGGGGWRHARLSARA